MVGVAVMCTEISTSVDGLNSFHAEYKFSIWKLTDNLFSQFYVLPGVQHCIFSDSDYCEI